MKNARKTLLNLICTNMNAAMESLISKPSCRSGDRHCDSAMLGGLVKAMAWRELDHWFSSRFEGVADSITDCVSGFSSLLCKVRSETVTASGRPHHYGGGKECSPWTSEDEQYGSEGTTILDDLALDYAGHLRKQAEKSGLDPELLPG